MLTNSDSDNHMDRKMMITYNSFAFFIQRALRSRFDCFLKWKALSCIVEVLSTRSSIRSPLSKIFSMLSTMMVRTWMQKCEMLRSTCLKISETRMKIKQLRGANWASWVTDQNGLGKNCNDLVDELKWLYQKRLLLKFLIISN